MRSKRENNFKRCDFFGVATNWLFTRRRGIGLARGIIVYPMGALWQADATVYANDFAVHI